MARIKKMEDEQKKSNDRIQALEEMVEKLKKEIVNIDAAKMNQMMLNSATKVELQTMNIEVKRAMTGI
jgi:lysozyme family protein